MLRKLTFLIAIASLCAACGTAPEPTMLPPGDGVRLPAAEKVTAKSSALAWTGSAIYVGGLIDCGGGTTWAPGQPIIQSLEISPPPLHFDTSFWAADWDTWHATSHAEYNQMAILCTSTPGGSITSVRLYDGGDGGWYSHTSLACSVYTHGAIDTTWRFDSNVTVSPYEAVYYPASGSNGAWGLILRWNGNGSGTRNLWHSCGFQASGGGALWYLFY